MNLQINPHDKTPVYRQIQQQIAKGISDRRIHPGEWLQPEQELAAELVVSPAAVRKAYEGLRSDGLCDSPRQGSCRVTSPRLGAAQSNSRKLALAVLEKELLASELEMAREVQRRLLPSADQRGDSWCITARCYPSGVLAGDFFDVIQLDHGILDIVVADVAGKGLAAGLIMAATRSMLSPVSTLDSPGEALTELNRQLLPLLSSREFVAMAYARFDPGVGSLQIANAGLPDPYLLDHTGELVNLEVDGNRLPLGVRRDVDYSTRHVLISPADRMLLYTDGIPESTNAAGEPLGYEGFASLLRRSANGSRDAGPGQSMVWLDRLLEQTSHQTGSILEDDWTAVLLDYIGN